MMNFFKIIFPAVFLMLAALTPAFATGGSGAADVVSSLEKRYEAISTLTADFTQVSKGLASMDGNSGGLVFFKKPGKIRWTYKGEVADEIIGDGLVLWFYQPELNQAFKSSGRRPDIATDFLSGMGSIRRHFIASPSPVKAGAVTIRLEPRKAHPQIKTLLLLVDIRSMLVRKFILTDHYGNTSEVSFSNIKINTPLGDELFDFSPPEGTDVIVQQGEGR